MSCLWVNLLEVWTNVALLLGMLVLIVLGILNREMVVIDGREK